MQTKPQKRREGDGGTYLVIADDTPEFMVAFDYAVHMARLHRGHVALARIIEPVIMGEWMGVEDAVRDEARAKAENELGALVEKATADSGITPSLIIREGHRTDEIISIAKGNPALVAIVFGSGAEKPGPLISYFTAKGLTQLTVPIIIVPGHLNADDVKKLT